MNAEDMKNKLYDAYQLDWMMSHGYGLNHLMEELTRCGDLHDFYISNLEDSEFMQANVSDIFHDWEFNRGFGSEIWACHDEFSSHELLDQEYMEELIGRMPPHLQEEIRDAYQGYMKGEEKGASAPEERHEEASAFTLTAAGLEKVNSYIASLTAKRKEILDAGKDTAEDFMLPVPADIVNDIQVFYDEELKEYCNAWGVTDNYDADFPLHLELGKDFLKTRVLEVGRMGSDRNDDARIVYQQGNRIGTISVPVGGFEDKKNHYMESLYTLSDREAAAVMMRMGDLLEVPALKNLPLIDEQSHALQTIFRELSQAGCAGRVCINQHNCDAFLGDIFRDNIPAYDGLETLEDSLRDFVCDHPAFDGIISFPSEKEIERGASPIVIDARFPALFAMRDRNLRGMVDALEDSLKEIASPDSREDAASMTLEEAMEKRGIEKEDFFELMEKAAKSKEIRLGEPAIAGAIGISTQKERKEAVRVLRDWMGKQGKRISRFLNEKKTRNMENARG